MLYCIAVMPVTIFLSDVCGFRLPNDFPYRDSKVALHGTLTEHKKKQLQICVFGAVNTQGFVWKFFMRYNI